MSEPFWSTKDEVEKLQFNTAFSGTLRDYRSRNIVQ